MGPLQTPRLLLCPWVEGDWTVFRPIAQDPAVMRFINDGLPWPDALIQQFVQRQVECYSARGYCRWKLIHKETGELAGFCGAGLLDGLADPEIGWWLARAYWGQGLAIEAARVAMQDLFKRIELDRLISVAMPANVRSIQVMRKLGLRYQCDAVRKGFSVVIYEITRDNYLSQSVTPRI